MSSIYTGVSGMQASQKAVDLIANNVANLNTVAYKASRPSFEEALISTLQPGTSGVNPEQIGMGVMLGSIEQDMTQGSLRQTGRPLDLAIAGDGFFAITDGTKTQFTRAGVFELDVAHRLVLGSTGLSLVGWSADIVTGKLDTSATPTGNLLIPTGTLYAVQTKTVGYGGNLDSNTATPITTSFNVYDSLGGTHVVNLTFTKTATAGQWTVSAASTDGAVTIPAAERTVAFDTNGTPTSGLVSLSLALPATSGAITPLDFKVNMGSLSQLNGDSTVQAVSQDGLPIGTLLNYSVDEEGKIVGTFSNGASRILGQVALANFTNPAGLLKDGTNLWSVSANSGSPVLQPASVGGAKIRGGYLEQSNVDLTTEFASLIVSQRGFQANSRSITTADEIMQEVLQMKR